MVGTRNFTKSKTKSKYWQRTHKFGIRIPKSAREAQAIDAENGDMLWWDAIMKEMRNVRPAFEKSEKSKKDLPVGYQKIKCHFVFDIKGERTSGGKHIWWQMVTKQKRR